MTVRREDGFTVVEVLVAILVFGAGMMAVLQVIDVSNRNAFRAEQNQVGINIAQRELEKIRQLDYDDVALSSAPAASGDPDDPRHRVSGQNFALERDGGNPAQMVISGVDGQTTGAVDPGPTSFTFGDVSGRIWRFVTWRNESGCDHLGACPGGKDYKRVVVVVRIDDAPVSFEHRYQEMQSDFTDPEASLTSGGGPGTGALVTAQQFFLSDTACGSGSEDPARQEITDHPTHDTLGSCSGAAATRPDSLLTTAPHDPDPQDPNVPAVFDYATDVEPGGTSATHDKGLQMLRQDVNGCTASPTGADAKKKVHRFVTRPMPIEFVATGSATVELYTRTIGDVNIPGAMCVFLFKRTVDTSAGFTRVAIPLLAIQAHVDDPFGFTCQTTGTAAERAGRCATNVWPRDDWGRARFNLSFAPNTELLPGERLELGLSVEREGTPQDALQFLYDHPDYPSRLEVKTLTPLDG